MRRFLSLAARQLRSSPGFAAAVIATLALAIGVNTAVFSVLDGFLLRRLPYPEPNRLGALVLYPTGSAGARAGVDQTSFDGATWLALHDHLSVATVASWGATVGVNLRVALASGAAVRYVHETRVSARYFEVLGIPLYLGASFTPVQDRPGGPNLAVLSYDLWHSLGAGPDLVGRQIELSGVPYTVVGVLPAAAVIPAAADLYVPLRPALTGECGGMNCSILMRLDPRASWQQANAQLTTMPQPQWARRSVRYAAIPLQLYLAGDMGGRSEALLLAVGVILLIACGNLAGLMLVRLARRTPEIATRLALGA